MASVSKSCMAVANALVQAMHSVRTATESDDEDRAKQCRTAVVACRGRRGCGDYMPHPAAGDDEASCPRAKDATVLTQRYASEAAQHD